MQTAFPDDWENRKPGPQAALDPDLCGKWKVRLLSSPLLSSPSVPAAPPDVLSCSRRSCASYSNSGTARGTRSSSSRCRSRFSTSSRRSWRRRATSTSRSTAAPLKTSVRVIPQLGSAHRPLNDLTRSSLTRPSSRAGMPLVDEFNDPAGDIFCFLISTRAGGVGLNLTAANRVRPP